jgi:small conductance mechanosensitive channel
MFRRASFLIAILFASVAAAQTQPAATTQPTTQVVVVQTLGSESPASLIDQMAKTRFGEIIEGKRSLTWEEIRKPEFWYETVKDLMVTLVLFIPRLVGTIIFLLVFYLIYRGIRRVAMGSLRKGEVDSSIRDLLGSVIKWGILGFGVVIACNQLGIPIVAMLTGVSIIGLAVGFAAQETLANFIAGIVIFLDKPIKMGDWINISGDYGQVKRVTFRATRILTLDGEVVIIPNTQVLSTKFSNHSTHPLNRVNIAIGIAYKASIADARKAMLALFKDDSRICKEPVPEVIVKDLAASSVDLVLRFWIVDESIEHRIGYEYREKAKNALDAAGIEIPFPHLQLLLENTPAMAALTGGKGRGE